MIDLDKTVFSGGRASLLRPLPSFRNGAARTGRRDFLGLVGLYTGAKVRLFRRTGKKSALYSLRPPEKQLFRHLSLVFPSLFQVPHPIHIAVTHHIIETSPPTRGKTLNPPPEGAAEAADGGAHASSGGTSPRSPPGEGETPRGRSKATGGNPVSDAATRGIGGSGARETLNPPPESAAEAAGGGAHASSGGTSPRSPPGEGETPRDQSARNPRNRQVGCRGGSKSPRVPAPASGAAVAPPRPPTIDGASGQSVAKPRRGGADIRPREWPDAPPKRAVRAWPWAIVRSRREKTAPPPCLRAGGRCGANESM